MKQVAKSTGSLAKHSWPWVVLVILLLALGLAVKIAWWNGAGYPKFQRMYYGYQVRRALTNERKALQDPLGAVGFKNIQGGKSTCYYAPEYGYVGLKLTCAVQLKSYIVLPTDAQSLANINAKAKTLSDLMAKNGWKAGNTALVPWFQGITKGIDYQPDQFNYKHVGNLFCTIDYTTAFSRPKPPAMNVVMECDAPDPNKVAGQY